jgi:single-strand DNA-binding protein
MADYNKVILLGNLATDPEIRITPRGTPVTQLRFAVSRRNKAADGTEHEEVNFFDVEAWGKTAEVIGAYLTKGKPLLIEGRLKQERWADKTTGKNRERTKVMLESFRFVGKKDENEPGGAGDTSPSPAPSPAPASGHSAASSGQPPPTTTPAAVDEDSPF